MQAVGGYSRQSLRSSLKKRESRFQKNLGYCTEWQHISTRRQTLHFVAFEGTRSDARLFSQPHGGGARFEIQKVEHLSQSNHYSHKVTSHYGMYIAEFVIWHRRSQYVILSTDSIRVICIYHLSYSS